MRKRSFNLAFDKQCRFVKLREIPVAEHRFHPTRRWRFDWAFKAAKIALEVEGGAWTQGRHTRGSGFVKDMEKYNEAQILGWRILRVTPQALEDGTALSLIERMFREAA